MEEILWVIVDLPADLCPCFKWTLEFTSAQQEAARGRGVLGRLGLGWSALFSLGLLCLFRLWKLRDDVFEHNGLGEFHALLFLGQGQDAHQVALHILLLEVRVV